ncbi:hypothetical protein [Microbacterium kyungheense]|uniref:Uncharacterized protein n=2 Tax=Microbacterium kyungheense TaxID=1263636 RepID=A0A543EU43_9MICO|nr:hypothetical protein FB391_2549 [Microbacterium kyungheense]
MTRQHHADIAEAPRPLSAMDRRFISWTIAMMFVFGYVIWQLVGVATVKDAAPPSWLISAPSGAVIAGEPRTTHQPYRATTSLTVRPADGGTNEALITEMGLSEDEPTQIGPTPLDWRPVWVYARPTNDGFEVRLVYLRDAQDTITP